MLNDLIGYRIVAYILLFTVSLLAILFDIRPVLLAAVLSALIWNFFFIPPTFTFHIGNTEDSLLFLIYFIIALINAVLTAKVRNAEKKVRAKEEQERTIALYNTFVNSLSHELRTPIATIFGAVDVLKNQEIILSETDKYSLLQQIDDAGVKLNEQVENLLNTARLENGMLQLRLDWCDINELIFITIKQSEPVSKHCILFEPRQDLPLFKIDGGVVKQILYNLLHNSIRYTPEGSEIMIEATMEGECLLLRISDNGPGIPETEAENIFRKFYRINGSPTGGTGLGLSIVKGFAEAHNAIISVHNKIPHGAVFAIRICAEHTYFKPPET